MHESHIRRTSFRARFDRREAVQDEAKGPLATCELEHSMRPLSVTAAGSRGSANAWAARGGRDEFDLLLIQRDELELARLFAAATYDQSGWAHHRAARNRIQDRLEAAQAEVDAWLGRYS